MIKPQSIEEVIQRSKSIKGKIIKDLDYNQVISDNKGQLGYVIEEGVFGVEKNPDAKPDLDHLGIEIKMTPIIKGAKKYRAKERLVLGIINYMDENWDNFYQSHFWTKNQKLLIIFYEHLPHGVKELFPIVDFLLFEFPEEDLRIIMSDWMRIANKVKNGKAHVLSESEGLYLGACTKGANSSSVRTQPYSHIPAKQRAYSFKTSYMTTLFDDYITLKKENKRIINDLSQLESKSFEEIIHDMFKPFIGLTQEQLVQILSLENHTSSKALNSLIIQKILKLESPNLSQYDEIKKGNILPKTIRIESNGSIKEHMSFPTFKFTEIVNEEWEDSSTYLTLSEARFMLIVFQKQDNYDYSSILKGIFFWSMPESDIESCKDVWQETKKTIIEGVKLIKVNGRNLNNLPKPSDHPIMHVRPHARDADDTYPLPDGRQLTKQCFWLNKEYIKYVINSFNN